MAAVIDFLKSFDGVDPFSGMTQSGMTTGTGRNGLGAAFGFTMERALPAAIPCSADCSGGSAVRQRVTVGCAFKAGFLPAPTNDIVRLRGNYGIEAGFRHAGDGRLLAWVIDTTGGSKSDPSNNFVFRCGAWYYLEMAVDFFGEACPDPDIPSVVNMTYQATVTGRVNMGPTGDLPTTTFSNTFAKTTTDPIPQLDNAIWTQASACAFDDIYILQMDACGDAVTFLGDLFVNSDDATYTQNASDVRESQEGMEVALLRDDSQLRESQEGMEVILLPDDVNLREAQEGMEVVIGQRRLGYAFVKRLHGI